MYTDKDIIAKAWLVIEVCKSILSREVEKIFLVGSYASGKQDDWSDIDFVVQLKAKNVWDLYPAINKMDEVNEKLGPRIHVIFGSEGATKSLHQKHKSEEKSYAYKEINLGDNYVPNTRSSSS